MGEDVDNAVAALIAAVKAVEPRAFDSIQISVQANGQYPYTVTVLEEQHPPIGLAIEPSPTEDSPATSERSGRTPEGRRRG